MIFDRQKLLVSLKQCMPGIDESLIGSDTFTFYNGRIYTYNEALSISKKIDFCSEDEVGKLKFAIKGEEFYKIIEKFKFDEIKVEITENSLKMSCDKSKVELPFIEFEFEKRFDMFENLDGWEDVDENIINGIVMCRILNNKSTLNGIFISEDNVYSTDGYQINKFKLNKKIKDFYIDDKTAQELVKFSNFKKILIGKWLHLMNDEETIFSVRLMECEKYPVDKIENIFDSVDFETKKYTLPEDLIEVVDRASVFGADIESRNVIELTFYENKIKVSSERNSGKFCEEMELNYSFDFEKPISIFIDKDMILYALKNNMEFKILNNTPPRIYLTTEHSMHIMSTFEG